MAQIRRQGIIFIDRTFQDREDYEKYIFTAVSYRLGRIPVCMDYWLTQAKQMFRRTMNEYDLNKIIDSIVDDSYRYVH